MSKSKQTNDIDEISSYLAEALEALMKEDILKADQMYHKAVKLKKKLGIQEVGVLDGQIKRLEHELKMLKAEIKAEKTEQAAMKTATVVTGIVFMFMVYAFMNPSITGLATLTSSEIPSINMNPVLDVIPNFKLEIGNEFVYKVYANDPNRDNLVFTDDTDFFDISSDGLIKFTPTKGMEGIYYIAIIAKDMKGGIDIQAVKFIIGDVVEQPIVQVQEETIEEVKESEGAIVPVTEESFDNLNESNDIEAIANETYQTENPISDIQVNSSGITDVGLNNSINQTNQESNLTTEQ